jgi:hypothetical protein
MYLRIKGPDTPDAIRQCDMEFKFSKYLEGLSHFKLFCLHIFQNLLSLAVLSTLKTEKSSRVVKSRPVCLDLKGPHRPNAIRQRDANFQFSKTNKTVNG